MAINTSRLTERLEIFEITSSASTIGEVVETLTRVKIVYASLLSQKGDVDYNKLPGAVYEDVIVFYCRYLPISSKKKYRLEYNGNSYYISEINHIGRNEASIIRCTNVR